MTNRPQPFGVHLMVDGCCALVPLITDASALRGLLDALPAGMGKHRLCEPVVVEVGASCLKDPGGLPGFVVISGSHTGLPAFPGRAS